MCTGTDWVDKRRERNPDEKECFSGINMKLKTNITFLILNIFWYYGIMLNVITNIPRIRGWKNETVKNIYTEYATF